MIISLRSMVRHNWGGDMAGSVEIDTDQGVTIRDHYGREIVRWTTDEFMEDHLAVLAACRAIKLFYTEGITALATKLGYDISHPDYVTLKTPVGLKTYPTKDLQ